jgi:hypothetical protein
MAPCEAFPTSEALAKQGGSDVSPTGVCGRPPLPWRDGMLGQDGGWLKMVRIF